jgi:type VI secretion system secreted protein VgrG
MDQNPSIATMPNPVGPGATIARISGDLGLRSSPARPLGAASRVNGSGKGVSGAKLSDCQVPVGTVRQAREADFAFTLGELDASSLKVIAFSGSEGLSELFQFHIELRTDDEEIDLEAELGQKAGLRIDGEGSGGEPVRRYVHGIVQRVERLGAGVRQRHYAIDLVPVHWYLTKRHQSRIFQQHNCADMSVPGIVRKVFVEAGIPEDSYRFSLQETYAPRDYVVQYRETDMAFISRLMEDEGICYFFEHDADGYRMVIGDGDVAFARTPGQSTIIYRERTGFTPRENHAFELRERREIQMGAVTLDDFDFKRPPLELRATSAADRFNALELSDYPGKYTDRAPGERYARIRLEEQQSGRNTLRMRATVRTLRPGYRFTLSEHPEIRLNGEYLVTHVTHVGRQTQSGEAEALTAPELQYEAEVSLLPASVTYRPARRTPRPTVLGSQTAIVVGPQTEEIFTDAYGRVKVQFHWDRAGAFDEFSSCWIRVSQGMAGGNYGLIFLPRVGQEVIVDFLEGDPDQPIITGRVYNNDHMPPYALPDAKTISAIRTCTSKGAGGGNEIRFDDAKGKEQVLVYAHNALHLRARGSRFESTGGDAHRTVAKNSRELVKENKHSIVTLDLVEEVRGNKNLYVRGDVKEYFNAKQTTFVNQQYNILNGDGIWLGSDTSITLWCQGNFIKLDASGVTIVGKMVDINSGGSASVAAPDSPDMADEPTPAATTEFGHNTRYHQAPSESEPDDHDEKQTSWIEIQLVDDLGQPCPGEAFRIRTPDGKQIDGTLDEKGLARVALRDPGQCQISFPNLDAAAWERL